MKTPAEWEDWCDEQWAKTKQYPTWSELVSAIQTDALLTEGQASPGPEGSSSEGSGEPKAKSSVA
jgi:hypothetical protein